MALTVQKFREIVFQFLYSRSFEECDGELSLIMRQNKIPKKAARRALEKMELIWKEKDSLDAIIRSKAIDYDLERISPTELALLRLGLYELLHTDLPPKVAIAESVRLTRKFATAEAAAFVNALIDAVYKERGDAKLSTEQITV